MATVPLKAVDRVEILSMMDNSIDVLMGNTPVAKRHKRGKRRAQRSAAARRAWRVDVGDDLLRR